MTDGYKGTQRPNSGAGEFNAMSFLITQLLNRVSTATLVKVKSVSNNGGISPVGFVSVQPMVHQLDGNGGIVPHGIIYNVPYFRLQGGANAIILDPQEGDIGLCIFASRDISAVKATKAPATPGSQRKFDMADGLYVGGFLNGAPQQYVQFNASGITAVSPTKITCQAPEVEMDAATQFKVTSPDIILSGNTTIDGALSQGTGGNGGAATLAGPVTVQQDLTAAGKSVSQHEHNDPQGGTTSAPI